MNDATNSNDLMIYLRLALYALLPTRIHLLHLFFDDARDVFGAARLQRRHREHARRRDSCTKRLERARRVRRVHLRPDDHTRTFR